MRNKGLKMLPINRLDKFLFICLYNFANSFKLYIYIPLHYCWDAKNLASARIHTWPPDA